jgi:hypothetical protein
VVKSNTKPELKGGIKPLKKGSTLASIMKIGGISSAAGGKALGKEKQVKVQASGTYKGGVWKHTEEDVVMSDAEHRKKPITVTKSMDGSGKNVDMEGLDIEPRKGTVIIGSEENANEDEVMIVGVQSSAGGENKVSYETMSKDATEQEIVSSWETRLQSWKKRWS